MQSCIISLVTVLALALSYFPMTVSDTATEDEEEVKPNTVYTTFVQGNSSHTGNGTQEDPYNLFMDALDAVADGGTIYVGTGAFVNDESDGQPLKITKNVKIASADNSSRPVLTVRKGGIVLGANVDFENIVISLPNPDHAVLCANGYTLTLNNVSYSSGTRVMQLAGGSLYSKYGTSLSPESGSGSRIIISGSDTRFENIYAGSINGSFDNSVEIYLDGISGTSMGTIYSSGAEEGYYNSENFLDPDNEPEAPTADAVNYPVKGGVTIKLTDSTAKYIDGLTGGDSNASVEVSASNYYSSNLDNVGLLTVKNGTFAPTALNDGVSVSLPEGGTLDLSSLSQKSINNFTASGGKLVLASTDCLTIAGDSSGTAVFEANSSGLPIAEYNHLYIKTTGKCEFEFTPYVTQSMKLEKSDDGWKTTEQSEDEPVFPDTFEITDKVLTVEQGIFYTIGISTSFAGEDGGEIGYIPFECSVIHDGEKVENIEVTTDDNDYYMYDIKDLNMQLAPIGDVIEISALDFEKEIPIGEYNIKFSVPTTNGIVTDWLILNVVADNTLGDTKTSADITLSQSEVSYFGKISVSADITSEEEKVTDGNAALYINGQKYETKSADSAVWENIEVTAENGFKTGENSIIVSYGGSTDYGASTAETSLTVTKASGTISHNGQDKDAVYTGESIGIDFGKITLTDENGNVLSENPSVNITYKNSDGDEVNPVMTGTYTAYIGADEGDVYSAVEPLEAATLTIKAAAPSVTLTANEKEGKVTLYTEVIGAIGGAIPSGSVTVKDKNNADFEKEISLSGGSGNVTLTDMSAGEHTLYAVYTPDDLNMPYTSAQSADVSVTVEETKDDTTGDTKDDTADNSTGDTKDDATESERKTWNVSGFETGELTVTFKNTSGNDIENAVILAAVYKDGVLQKFDTVEENVNVKSDEEKKFTYDFKDTEADNVKLFVWSGLNTMQPLCECYEQTSRN